MAMYSFSLHRQLSNHESLQRLLDDAFSVKAYTQSFPQIFSLDSSALIAEVRAESHRTLGMCAVDTEIWIEPMFLRGACVGSVAVGPQDQGRGTGSALLRWVIEELKNHRRHDFIYLFSDKPGFYESLGFVKAGHERLCALKPLLDSPKLDNEVRLVAPLDVASLSEEQWSRLWRAMESGRTSGESISYWRKFSAMRAMPQLWISWLEDACGNILAGSFLGKGIDFQGVMHNFFALHRQAVQEYLQLFVHQMAQLSNSILCAPGQWNECLKPFLDEKQVQHLCLVYGLEATTSDVVRWFDQGLIYPRSLFSS